MGCIIGQDSCGCKRSYTHCCNSFYWCPTSLWDGVPCKLNEKMLTTDHAAILHSFERATLRAVGESYLLHLPPQARKWSAAEEGPATNSVTITAKYCNYFSLLNLGVQPMRAFVLPLSLDSRCAGTLLQSFHCYGNRHPVGNIQCSSLLCDLFAFCLCVAEVLGVYLFCSSVFWELRMYAAHVHVT